MCRHGSPHHRRATLWDSASHLTQTATTPLSTSLAGNQSSTWCLWLKDLPQSPVYPVHRQIRVDCHGHRQRRLSWAQVRTEMLIAKQSPNLKLVSSLKVVAPSATSNAPSPRGVPFGHLFSVCFPMSCPATAEPHSKRQLSFGNEHHTQWNIWWNLLIYMLMYRLQQFTWSSINMNSYLTYL